MAAHPARDLDLDLDEGSQDGASAPAGLRVPPPERRAPIHDQPVHTAGRPPVMWLLGAHHRSGAGTLARIWAPAGDSAGGWPAEDRHRGVIVVARTDYDGLGRAHDVLLQAAAGLTGGCTLLGALLVPHAPGKLPKSLRRRADVVASAAPQIWTVPWIDDLPIHGRTELAVWSPADPAPAPAGRMRAPNPSTSSPHPDLAALGAEIFDRARIAYGR